MASQFVTHADNLVTKLIKITTEDENIEKKSNSSFKFNFLSAGLRNVRKLAIQSMCFRNNIYNVDVGYNTLSFTIGSDPLTLHTITIPPGDYSTASLRPVLEGLIAPIIAPSTIAITQDTDLTQKLTFTITGGETIRLFPSSDTDATLGLTYDNNTLARLLGITKDDGLLAIKQLNGIPNLNGLDFMYVHCAELANNNIKRSDGLDENVLDVIPIDTAFHTKQYYQPTDDDINDIEYSLPINLNKGTIELKDQYGNLINLNGGMVSIVLKVWMLT